ncbi:hypothetical protein Bbelb_120710 [Branchiostoma belcheri]|nr:hypothetical protein Bbelb_120710 [Branchiostoma belcheri]
MARNAKNGRRALIGPLGGSPEVRLSAGRHPILVPRPALFSRLRNPLPWRRCGPRSRPPRFKLKVTGIRDGRAEPREVFRPAASPTLVSGRHVLRSTSHVRVFRVPSAHPQLTSIIYTVNRTGNAKVGGQGERDNGEHIVWGT